MNEPTGTPPSPPTPPPAPPPTAPPPAAPPAKKKTNPWVWVGLGCLAILILIGGACVVSTFFLAKKAKEVVGDIQENPAKAAAEMIVKMSPDLDLVESDADSGTITVRNTETGEEATFDYSEIEEGRFTFKSDEGEMSFDAQQQGEGGTLTVTTDEGETRYGAGAAADELPGWVPLYPGASKMEAGFTSRSGDEVSGLWTLETGDPVDEVQEYYESKLEDEGFEVTVQTFTGPQGKTAVVSAVVSDPGRQITASITSEGGTTKVGLQYGGQS